MVLPTIFALFLGVKNLFASEPVTHVLTINTMHIPNNYETHKISHIPIFADCDYKHFSIHFIKTSNLQSQFICEMDIVPETDDIRFEWENWGDQSKMRLIFKGGFFGWSGLNGKFMEKPFPILSMRRLPENKLLANISFRIEQIFLREMSTPSDVFSYSMSIFDGCMS
jgi:hypothetical protein